jgi:phage terminase large subunit GpA-like protein
MTPTAWAQKSRRYPVSAGRPGKRDPYYTPYVVPFSNALDDVSYGVLCLVCGSQMGKTDAVLDMVGWRLDTRPRPQLYVGPSKDFLTDQLEPRIMQLLDQAPTLQNKVARGKRMKKTRKLVAGVPLRLAWAGSGTQLSSDQAGDVHVDELDQMVTDVKGNGDPLTVVKARGFTYRDRKVVVTSTPKKGAVDVEKDPESGLEFWKKVDPRDLESPIWKLWQSGTRHHWAWPCPCCGEYFIPRFRHLRWPEKATPEQAQRKAFMICPREDCGGIIEEQHKPEMNAKGVYVAPGQLVTPDGQVIGDPPPSLTLSFWVSGLASPFVTFGERAAAWLEAVASGDQEQVQGVINTGFGELYAPGGGDAPEWTEVAGKRNGSGYERGEVPKGVIHLTLTADVQKNAIYWVIRGWGARSTSWLIDHGVLYGPTTDEEIWADLADLVSTPVAGIPIRLAFVDSGFRPGKVDTLPLNRVYEFCRGFSRIVRPTKGSSVPLRTPLVVSKLEVTRDGRANKYGLELVRLDTDHWKSWVHERVRWPSDQLGAWHLPIDVDNDYCMQIVSEARVKRPSGKVQWVQRSKDNHYLDCEAMQGAAGYLLNAQRLSETARRREAPVREEARAASPAPNKASGDALGRPMAAASDPYI